MKINSKVEQLALQKIQPMVERAISIKVSLEFFDSVILTDLGDFWASKSPKVTIEKSISHVASTFLKGEVDLLEVSKPDRLKFLNPILQNQLNAEDHGCTGEVITIRICVWQIYLILSQAEIDIETAPKLIEFCLKKTALTKKHFFGESQR